MPLGPEAEDELIDTKVKVHDRKQFELKLEYQPSGTDPQSEYLVETLLFIPKSLNIDEATWSREQFYRDLHNYVRLKTPVLSFDELLTGSHSPLLVQNVNEDHEPVGLRPSDGGEHRYAADGHLSNTRQSSI